MLTGEQAEYCQSVDSGPTEVRSHGNTDSSRHGGAQSPVHSSRRPSKQQHEGPVSDSAIARFKLAIFARGPLSTKEVPGTHLRHPSTGKAASTSSGSSGSNAGGKDPTFVCIVFECTCNRLDKGWRLTQTYRFAVDTNNVEQVAISSADNRLTFEKSKPHSTFPVAVYRPSDGSTGSDSDVNPAVPLSPEVLKTDIRNSSTRVEKLALVFKNPAERENLLKIMSDYRVRSSVESLR